jgi:hypothetical protein
MRTARLTSAGVALPNDFHPFRRSIPTRSYVLAIGLALWGSQRRRSVFSALTFLLVPLS